MGNGVGCLEFQPVQRNYIKICSSFYQILTISVVIAFQVKVMIQPLLQENTILSEVIQLTSPLVSKLV